MQQNFNNRMNHVQLIGKSKIKVGKNILANRLPTINGLIEYDWLNLSRDSFKVKAKERLLK